MTPTRHGIESLSYDNIFHVVSPALKDRNPEQKPLTEPSKTDEDAGGWCGLPFHPTCFEIFKRVSLLRLGSIDVQGLWYWRLVCFPPNLPPSNAPTEANSCPVR